jgi:hypothetical protein
MDVKKKKKKKSKKHHGSAQLVGQLNAGWSSRKVSFTLLTAR